MLQERLTPLANRILNDAAFDETAIRFCSQISTVFKQEPRLVRAIGDFGAFATILCAMALASIHGGQFTLAAVQAIVVPRGWASSRRTRALIDWLELEGAARRHQPRDDNRERPWSLCGWLIMAIETLAEAYLAAAAPWEPQPVMDRPAKDDIGINSLIDGVGWLLKQQQELIPTSMETLMFLGHAPGFPLLLDLLSAAKTSKSDASDCEFSRKAAARAYGVSRAQVTALLAKAERLTILKRDGSRILLSDRTLQNVQRDLAQQLAFVVVWLGILRA